MARKRKTVTAFKHEAAKRSNIPTVEHEPVMEAGDQRPLPVTYERRNRDLDPQLVWRGKDEQDLSDLRVPAPPLFIQEKVKPKVLIDDLLRMTRRSRAGRQATEPGAQADVFGDFNGLPSDAAKTEFYQHDANWSNRMILGDSLQVMASLAEREGLRGKVQCIYMDPPYGIKFNSNFQWSTTSRDVKDGKAEHITREPEQVKAFRDTWQDGIHSYLTYLRDRLTVARNLLTESGSIFVQIGDENVHLVRAVLDEVFGRKNFVTMISFRTHSPLGVKFLPNPHDYILWFGRDKEALKYRNLWLDKPLGTGTQYQYVQDADGTRRTMSASERSGIETPAETARVYRLSPLRSTGYTPSCTFSFDFQGRTYPPPNGRSWATTVDGMGKVVVADRAYSTGSYLNYLLYHDDFAAMRLSGAWGDTYAELAGTYVVQTSQTPIERCILMATDPSDLVLDPTCGSGTTAYVAEQWGRRWIAIDTSRVALALARSRVMGARYPYYLLADSPQGQRKEAELSRTVPSTTQTYGDIRHGFVYQRVPHITLKAIANNAEIDLIYERLQPDVEAALTDFNDAMRGHESKFEVEVGGRKGKTIDFTAGEDDTVELPSGERAPAGGFLEWEVPRQPADAWTDAARDALARFWDARIARQREIDACIAARAEHELLYDKPFEDRSKARVAGPFTVESLSPHRFAALDENDELIAPDVAGTCDTVGAGLGQDFDQMILENLRTAGVQQARKDDRITFSSLEPWPGELVCAEGRYGKASAEKRAAVFIGPEFGTVGRADLVDAAREAAEAEFDVLIACAFNYDAPASTLTKYGKILVLQARMNADLHMATDLKQTDKANLFVIFGEPDIDIEAAPTPDGEDGWVQVKIKGVDVFDPAKGQRRSDDTDGIACWFVDTDYDSESFFVRQAYFLGAGDPYKSLKTTLKAEIDRDAWETLHKATSRPFPKPSTGRIAVKVINYLGDEVMKVFRP